MLLELSQVRKFFVSTTSKVAVTDMVVKIIQFKHQLIFCSNISLDICLHELDTLEPSTMGATGCGVLSSVTILPEMTQYKK